MVVPTDELKEAMLGLIWAEQLVVLMESATVALMAVEKAAMWGSLLNELWDLLWAVMLVDLKA